MKWAFEKMGPHNPYFIVPGAVFAGPGVQIIRASYVSRDDAELFSTAEATRVRVWEWVVKWWRKLARDVL